MKHVFVHATAFLATVLIYGCGEQSAETDSPASETETVKVLPGQKIFATKCQLCHEFKTDKLGPALQEAPSRWNNDTVELAKYIRNSPDYIENSGNAYAQELFIKWNKVEMQPFPDLSDEDINQLIEFMAQ